MKSIDIIKKLCYDSSLIEKYGGYPMKMDSFDDSKESFGNYCAGYFGTTDENTNPLPWRGIIENGKDYFYLYIPKDEVVSIYKQMGELPDAYCERKENDVVALWRID